MLIHQGLKHPNFKYLYETVAEPAGDLFLKAHQYLVRDSDNLTQVKSSALVTEDLKFMLTFSTYSNKKSNHPEYAYVDLCNRIINKGVIKPSRTGINVMSKWGEHLEIEMYKDGFPLFTTKKVFFKGVVEELLFSFREKPILKF